MEKMMVNNKMKMSQVLMLLLLAALIFITPLLSTSLRHTYLYFIINLLIIALGAEAGLLKAFSNHPQDHNNKIIKTTPLDGDDHKTMMINININGSGDHKNNIMKKVVEKSKSEKIHVGAVVKMESIMKKCPSMPSLFFIGGGDGHEEDVVVVEEEEEDMSGQELFTKAETFIGNFYKQLKMQREDSWQRIHGFYQKAF